MPMDSIDSSVYDLLRRIVRTLVDQKEEVRITPAPQPDGVCLGIVVHKEDIGRLIGQQANTVKSLQLIFLAIGVKRCRRLDRDCE
jgi:predicted RNA-binding protein YlqC (UPF0109 family)